PYVCWRSTVACPRGCAISACQRMRCPRSPRQRLATQPSSPTRAQCRTTTYWSWRAPPGNPTSRQGDQETRRTNDITSPCLPISCLLVWNTVSFPPSVSVHASERSHKGDVQVRGNTTFVGVDRRARLLGKALTIGTLVLLLSVLYLLLIGLLTPHFDAATAPVGYMLATVLIAVLVVPLRNRLGIAINRLLRHEWQSSQDLLHEFGVALSRTIDPTGLYSILTIDLARRLRLQSATIWMLEPPNDLAFIPLGPLRDDAGG